MIVTPYRASAEKIAFIKETMSEITEGESKQRVIELLGEPDETRPIYDRNIKKALIIGESLWYVLGRDSDTGSFKERNQSFVRISLTSEGIVSDVYAMGRDFPD